MPDEPCECAMGNAPIAGVHGWDSPSMGVERCDMCEVFPGDAHAAFALAEHLGEKAWCYKGTGDAEKDEEMDLDDFEIVEITQAVLDDETFFIACRTDPWVEPVPSTEEQLLEQLLRMAHNLKETA